MIRRIVEPGGDVGNGVHDNGVGLKVDDEAECTAPIGARLWPIDPYYHASMVALSISAM